jgi:hypothetical protein
VRAGAPRCALKLLNGSAAVTQGPPRYAQAASTAFSSASRLVEVATVSVTTRIHEGHDHR